MTLRIEPRRAPTDDGTAVERQRVAGRRLGQLAAARIEQRRAAGEPGFAEAIDAIRPAAHHPDGDAVAGPWTHRFAADGGEAWTLAILAWQLIRWPTRRRCMM